LDQIFSHDILGKHVFGNFAYLLWSFNLKSVGSSIFILHFENTRDFFFESKERNGISWLRAGIWKLRGARRGFEEDICSLCMDREDVHILKYLEMKE
jgi:hypothetical protein